MKKLSPIEWTVLNGIPHGEESPITTNDLCKLTGLDTREVRQSVSILINQYGVPVVAKRSGNRGIFIATNEAEREAGLASFANQVTNMAVRIDAIKNADLDHWQDGLALDVQALNRDNQEDAG